ncbi:MAG: hypothetical protein M1822_006777 [Bathelium mastoideum]|nr:MAG: hypothetical protein M1822_006777 [Bathelium mastoideum]
MEQPRSPRRRKDLATAAVSPTTRPDASDHNSNSSAWSRIRSSSFQTRGAAASSIRPVTPDSIPEDEVVTHSSSLEETLVGTPPGLSPTSSTHASPRIRPRGGGSALQHSRPTESAEEKKKMIMRERAEQGSRVVPRDAQTRPRTRTMDEAPRAISPPSLFFPHRNRIGSIHGYGDGTIAAVRVNGDAVTSIGHISTIPGASNHSSTSAQQRSIRVPPSESSAQADPLPSTFTVGPSAKRVLGLMKSTCGKMQGILAFRRGSSRSWELGYCAVDVEAGSLLYEPKDDTSYHKTLVPDLRGCLVRSAHDPDSQMPYIEVHVVTSDLEVHLRPHTRSEFDSWFAALLCWQPMQPKGIANKMAKAQPSVQPEQRTKENRRHSEIAVTKDAPIIKVGKMIFWDTNVSYSNMGTPRSNRPTAYRMQSLGSRRWRRVSCTLRENGELKLFSEVDIMLVSVVQLSQLSRCAIQRLDPSVLDNEFCIAIYPQYTSGSTSLSLLQPIFLSLESRILYEVWIVLLRAFTIPQLYGPKQLSSSEDGPPQDLQKLMHMPTQDMFRMERSLSLKVVEAKLNITPDAQPKKNPAGRDRRGTDPTEHSHGFYVEVLLDGEVRAKTMTKFEGTSPFWREEFDFLDLPAVLSSASMRLKKSTSDQTVSDREHAALVQRAYGFGDGASGGYSGVTFDTTIGNVDIYLEELDAQKETEKWWPIVGFNGQPIGEILVKARAEESVILMSKDYQPMSELLHRFDNGLTLQLWQKLPGELAKTSEHLLNIFQVTGQASDWFMSLVEEEIDSIHKENPIRAPQARVKKRADSNDSGDSSTAFTTAEREVLVRDFGNKVTQEANLLFRANTLLTKALEIQMRRLGKEYLEETLTEKIKDINNTDADCEVDPNRIGNQQDLERNWRKLINVTKGIWNAIFTSATRCPLELKTVFRHIRACAEDRYGDFLRSVRYSSVSGFVFLRFFCPAVLNPKLFGLLKDHPRARARRTLTLVAKSLQGLANVTTFGSKETWMEPMNQFLTAHREEFKSFIDEVCTLSSPYGRSPSSAGLPPPPPAYSTPIAILNRLPPTSREGCPSLPYLIDHARNFAALVQLWLSAHEENSHHIKPEDGDIFKFHEMCVELDQRTRLCLERAERAERPSSGNSVKWEELVESLEDVQFGSSSRVDRRKSSAATATQEEGTPRPQSFINQGTAGILASRGSASASTASLSEFDLQKHAGFEKRISTGRPGSINGAGTGTDSNISSPVTPYSAGGTRRPQTFFPPPAISASTSASASPATTSARPSPTSYLDSQDSSDGGGVGVSVPVPALANPRHRARSLTGNHHHNNHGTPANPANASNFAGTADIGSPAAAIPERGSSIGIRHKKSRDLGSRTRGAATTPSAAYSQGHTQGLTSTPARSDTALPLMGGKPPSSTSTPTPTQMQANTSTPTAAAATSALYLHTNRNLSSTFSDSDDIDDDSEANATALPVYMPQREREDSQRRGGSGVGGKSKLKKGAARDVSGGKLGASDNAASTGSSGGGGGRMVAGLEVEREREKAKSRGSGFLPGWKKRGKDKGENY